MNVRVLINFVIRIREDLIVKENQPYTLKLNSVFIINPKMVISVANNCEIQVIIKVVVFVEVEPVNVWQDPDEIVTFNLMVKTVLTYLINSPIIN